jgi:hypothetical protein
VIDLYESRHAEPHVTMRAAISLSNTKQCSGSRGKALRRRCAAAGLVALVVLLGSCSREPDAGLPVACGADTSAVREALRTAPEEVSVDGTPLSACFDDTSDGGEVQQIGATYLAVAADLSTSAAADPDGEAAVQLAYLVGAVQRGASGSQGIHYELARRLEHELDGLGPPAPEVREALRAGRAGG